MCKRNRISSMIQLILQNPIKSFANKSVANKTCAIMQGKKELLCILDSILARMLK